MQIPSSIKIGKNRYSVFQQPATAPGHYGRISFTYRNIYVNTHNHRGLPRTPAGLHETFWHEVTHGVLEAMGHKLYKNEKFVTEFASLLSKAIDSARFE